MMSVRIREVRYIPINLVAIPIKNRWNPVITLFTNYKVSISGNISFSNSCTRTVNSSLPRTLLKYLQNFLDALSNELNIDLCYKLEITFDKEIGDLRSSLYVSISQSLLDYVLKTIGEEMDPVDVVKSLTTIDRSINIKSQYIEALRLASVLNKSLIFRRIDEYIELKEPPLITKLTVRKIYRVKDPQNFVLEGDLGDLLTKLIGYFIISIARDLLEKNYRDFIEKVNYINRFWSLIYGLPITKKHYVYDEWGRVILADIAYNKLDF